MFSSINPWKNVECKISKKSFKYLNRYFQLPSFRTEKISHNLIATSGFLHSYRSSSSNDFLFSIRFFLGISKFFKL